MIFGKVSVTKPTPPSQGLCTPLKAHPEIRVAGEESRKIPNILFIGKIGRIFTLFRPLFSPSLACSCLEKTPPHPPTEYTSQYNLAEYRLALAVSKQMGFRVRLQQT